MRGELEALFVASRGVASRVTSCVLWLLLYFNGIMTFFLLLRENQRFLAKRGGFVSSSITYFYFGIQVIACSYFSKLKLRKENVLSLSYEAKV